MSLHNNNKELPPGVQQTDLTVLTEQSGQKLQVFLEQSSSNQVLGLNLKDTHSQESDI